MYILLCSYILQIWVYIWKPILLKNSVYLVHVYIIGWNEYFVCYGCLSILIGVDQQFQLKVSAFLESQAWRLFYLWGTYLSCTCYSILQSSLQLKWKKSLQLKFIGNQMDISGTISSVICLLLMKRWKASSVEGWWVLKAHLMLFVLNYIDHSQVTNKWIWPTCCSWLKFDTRSLILNL